MGWKSTSRPFYASSSFYCPWFYVLGRLNITSSSFSYQSKGEFKWDINMLSHFRRETANENKQFKDTKTLISNSCLVRQSFQGYLCKSGIATFPWEVEWNYTYSLLKKMHLWKFWVTPFWTETRLNLPCTGVRNYYSRSIS